MELVKTSFSFPLANNTWDAVRYWAGMSARLKQADLACQVMAGFALRALRDAYGSKQGSRTDLTSPNNSAKLGFQEMVRQETGLSDDTVRNWMKMADAVKAKWKKLPIRERLSALISVPPSQWQDDDATLIADAVHKATDGRTQLEFMWELGLAKKPGAARGRKPGDGGRPKDMDLDGDDDDLLKEFRIDMALLLHPGDTTLKKLSTGELLKHQAEVKAYAARLAEILKHRQPTASVSSVPGVL